MAGAQEGDEDDSREGEEAARRRPSARRGRRAPQRGSWTTSTVELITRRRDRACTSEILQAAEARARVPGALARRTSSTTQKAATSRSARQKKVRTLTVNTVKSFAQTLRMMALSKELVESNDFATKRDAYYQSQELGRGAVRRADRVRHGDGRHRGAVLAATASSREQLRFIPDEHGGAVAGRLDRARPATARPGAVERIDCTRFGSGAYSIPSLGRAPDVRDRREVHPRDRDRRHVPAPAEPQVLADRELHPGLDGRRARRARRAASSASSPTSARSRSTRSSTATPTASQHLPHAQGRLGQRGAPQPVLLRAAGALPRRDAAGHPRLQAADAPAARRRHQARARTRSRTTRSSRRTSRGRRRSSSCSRWACAPSSRRSRSGASTT